MRLFPGRRRRGAPLRWPAVSCTVVLASVACTGPRATPAPAPVADGLTIRLTSVPAGTPESATVYVAGTFNGWHPAAAGSRLTRDGAGYVITLPDTVRGTLAFKFTLGSWETVETTASGGDVPNRTVTVPPAGATTYTGAVAGWRHGPPAPRPHTATASVSVLSDDFPVPQLGRTRRVWIYLPPGYAASGTRHPVLYLQDGQNVFDAATSYAGEWGVDEALDSLDRVGGGAIVVAVDNGGASRMNEYMPWPSAIGHYGGGEGAQYVDFLVGTLKPYVDAHYRTLPDRVHTGIGGSSLGGLIALYAALAHPDVFGRVLAFSTPFFLNPRLFELARELRPRRPASRFYFDTGLAEGATDRDLPDHAMARSLEAMVDTLAAAGIDTAADVRALLPPDGEHAEWFWRREFPAAYRWLFAAPSDGPAHRPPVR
jgi:predicted alpha/beta superfamily hydrolase